MSGQRQRTTTSRETTTTTTDRKPDKVEQVNTDYTVGTLKNDRDSKFADTEGGGIRDDEVKAESGGLGGWLGGIAESIASVLNPQNTQMDDIPTELIDGLGDGTVLRFAFNPTDMEALALGDERRALEAVGDILTVNNPSQEVMEYLLGSEKFTDLVWSGHGSEDGLFTTGTDGKSSLMENDAIAEMLESSSIEEVFFAVCDGGRQLDDMVNEAGIDTYAYNRKVGDEEALGDLQDFVTGGDLDSVEGRTIEIPDFSFFNPFGGGFAGPMGTQTINIGGHHQYGESDRRNERRSRNRNRNRGRSNLLSLFGLGPKSDETPQTGPAPTPTPTVKPQPTPTPKPAQPPPALGPVDRPLLPGRSSFDQAATGFNLGGINYL